MSATTNPIKYLLSDDVIMFPSSFRQSKYVEAKATSEEAFTTLKTISNNKNNQNYAYEEDLGFIVIVLKGYRFKIEKEKLEDQFTSLASQKICAFIRTVEHSDNDAFSNRIGRTLISASTATDKVLITTDAGEIVEITVEVLDTGSDEESKFLGIGFFSVDNNESLLNDIKSDTDNYAYTILEFNSSGNLISNTLTLDSKNIRDVGGADSSKSIVENFSTKQIRLNNKLLFISEDSKNLRIIDTTTSPSNSMLNIEADNARAYLTGSTLSIKNSSNLDLNYSNFIAEKGLIAIDDGMLTVGCINNSGTLEKTKYGDLVVTGEAQISPSPLDPDNIDDGNIVGNDGGESALLLSTLGPSKILNAGLAGKAGSTVLNTSAQILYTTDTDPNSAKSLSLPLEISANNFENENSNHTRKIWTKKLSGDLSKPITNDWETLVDLIYPIGSIYMSTNNVNPGTLFGGMWERWAQGRTIFGVDSNKDGYNASVKTGGSYTRTLSVSNIPSHTHTGTIEENGTHYHGLYIEYSGDHTHTSPGYSYRTQYNPQAPNSITTSRPVSDQYNYETGSAGSHNHNGSTTYAGAHDHTLIINNTGSGTAFDIVPPYITCYIWRRIG